MFVLAGCAAVSEQGQATVSSSPTADAGVSAVRLVNPGEFASAIAEPERVTINVHVPFEGDLPGTDLSIPFDQIASQADRLPPDRTTPLAIYCRTGRMSAIASATLTSLGYVNVLDLRGGMQAWEASGRSLAPAVSAEGDG